MVHRLFCWSVAEPDADGADASAEIGLRALEEAIDTWRGQRGAALEGSAVFVEADPGRAARLREMLEKRAGGVTTEVLEGEFGTHAAAIQQRLGTDAAFLFVDPTGWKGADMAYIAQLAGRPYRDVLVNVMFDYLNRFDRGTPTVSARATPALLWPAKR